MQHKTIVLEFYSAEKNTLQLQLEKFSLNGKIESVSDSNGCAIIFCAKIPYCKNSLAIAKMIESENNDIAFLYVK